MLFQTLSLGGRLSVGAATTRDFRMQRLGGSLALPILKPLRPPLRAEQPPPRNQRTPRQDGSEGCCCFQGRATETSPPRLWKAVLKNGMRLLAFFFFLGRLRGRSRSSTLLFAFLLPTGLTAADESDAHAQGHEQREQFLHGLFPLQMLFRSTHSCAPTTGRPPVDGDYSNNSDAPRQPYIPRFIKILGSSGAKTSQPFRNQELSKAEASASRKYHASRGKFSQSGASHVRFVPPSLLSRAMRWGRSARCSASRGGRPARDVTNTKIPGRRSTPHRCRAATYLTDGS